MFVSKKRMEEMMEKAQERGKNEVLERIRWNEIESKLQYLDERTSERDRRIEIRLDEMTDKMEVMRIKFGGSAAGATSEERFEKIAERSSDLRRSLPTD